MTITAICPVSDMPAVNAALGAAGHGPEYFSFPIYNGGSRPSHATLHAWDDANFLASLTADARVTVDTSGAGLVYDKELHCGFPIVTMKKCSQYTHKPKIVQLLLGNLTT